MIGDPEAVPVADLSPAVAPANPLRIAAAGDLHCDEHNADAVCASVEQLRGRSDLVLLAGDLTTLGRAEQARPLAKACSRLGVPVLAVLGNHDWHSGEQDKLTAVFRDAGVQVLDRSSAVVHVADRVHGMDRVIGVVGVKGFIGGFSGSHLPDFGEPLMREVFRETSRDVEALDRGLCEIESCPTRVVLMHYAPTESTIVGEEPGIWPFLGSDRLAGPIAQHEPDLVIHGHAHGGTFSGAVGRVPVYNVAAPVIDREFWIFELVGPVPQRAWIR